MATGKVKVCNDCGFEGDSSQFVLGRRLCKGCQRGRMAKSRKKKVPELEFPKRSAKKQTKKADLLGVKAFSTREGLSDMLKDNLARAISDANDQVEFNKVRLALAMEAKDSNLIDDANRGLQTAMSHHHQLMTKLMDKLQAMEDLRAQQEKAKPTTFVFVQAPAGPKILPTRELPEDLQGVREGALA